MSCILIIEDNATLAYGLRNNLEIEGHEVRIGEDGARGLEQVDSWSPDLIILDLMLPDQDGFRVLRSLKDRGCLAPVLILTARGEEEDKVRGLRLGAEDYVTKPFGLLELLARIDVLLRRNRQDAPAGSHGPRCFGAIEVRPTARAVRMAAPRCSVAGVSPPDNRRLRAPFWRPARWPGSSWRLPS